MQLTDSQIVMQVNKKNKQKKMQQGKQNKLNIFYGFIGKQHSKTVLYTSLSFQRYKIHNLHS